jgi:hypothetical protein
MMNTPSLQAQMFPGVTFGPSLFAGAGGIASVTGPLAARVVGGGQLQSQPAASAVSTELGNLAGRLCSGANPCNTTARVIAVTSALCAAALGTAEVSIN